MLPIPSLCVLGINTKLLGEMSKVSNISPNLSDVNPIYLGTESTGSLISVDEEIVIVAIPIAAFPVTVTPTPTKFNCVIEPAAPTIVPSSLTVIP